MSFYASNRRTATNRGMPSIDLLHRLECKACPLDKITSNLSPHMRPSGTKKPLVYILGEAPRKNEDKQDCQFVGDHGQMLRARIPSDMLEHIRWNNVVRTRPPSDRVPDKVEIEACRPSIERDIAETKPLAIFGFGNIPLRWATGLNGVMQWRGRRTPVDIAGHRCWYFPFMHPAALLQMRSARQRERPNTEIVTEPERAFKFDLKRAFASIDNLPEPRVWTPKEAEANLTLIECSASGLEKAEQLLRWAGEQDDVGVDYETFRTRPYAEDAQILTAAVGHPEQSFAIPFDHPGAKWTKAQRKKLDELWRQFLLSGVRKWSHFLGFELEWSALFFGGQTLRGGLWGATEQQATILDERMGDTKPGPTSLEFLVQQHFGINIKSMSPLNKKDLRKEPLRDVLRYNGIDAKWHEMLGAAQGKLIREQGFQSNYEKDLRKLPTIVMSQIKGVPIHQPAIEILRDDYEGRVKDYQGQISALSCVKKFRQKYGTTFNPASSPDLGKMFSEVLNIKDVIVKDKKTGDDKWALDETIMDQISHPLASLIIKHRKAAKVLSTYILPYSVDSEFVWPDGCVHPIYNQPGTISNRTSAEDNNVQNIPKRNEETKVVRKAIRALKNHLYCSVDYGQIQFRGIAMMSRDKRLVKYIWDEHDVHQDWTNEIARAYPKIVGGKEFLNDWGKGGKMKAFRGDVKNQWTFPSVFGAHLASRAEYLNVPENILKPIDEKFWDMFSGIADWHKALEREYYKYGSVRCLDGRLMRAPLSKNQMINYPIQELEAEIVVGHGFCTVSERAEKTGDLYFQPNIEIHDDLTFMLPASEELIKAQKFAAKKDKEEAQYWASQDYYLQRIVDDMLSADMPYINVPLTIEASLGIDLYEMDEVLVASSNKWFK